MITDTYLSIASQAFSVNPVLLRLGLAAGGAAVGALSRNRRDDLLERALTKRQERTARIQRFATGNFNPNERALISAGNQDNLNALRGQLSAQGLSGGAAEELIARQRQAPFLALQQQALGAEGGALAEEEALISQLPDDDLTGFFDDIRGISENITALQELKKLPSIGGAGGSFIDDADISEATGLIEQLMGLA